MTGNERMSFCNTGSEAVIAALRVARYCDRPKQGGALRWFVPRDVRRSSRERCKGCRDAPLATHRTGYS